ncbi:MULTISPECIES: helix-turn-helix domain-containing protein [Micromonospora]|uniref:helix-turn-helix domain-containing protein n=1 Tax=unclassified Micromonospora TaxID=2617518 RepID=UPI001E4B9DF2|nr:helix-turn-helix domain-containing protein [Micromonospora sp. NBRC 110038]
MDELPVGRRVAYWRGRRNMSQQVFADRLGRSKSWVDKVERGVRALDRVSTLREVAAVLRIDPDLLIARDGAVGPEREPAADGVEVVRAALTRHPGLLRAPAAPTDPVVYRARVAHAGATYGHGRYVDLLRLAPALLVDGHRLAGGGQAEQLLQAYRLIAFVLVKLGAAELAWLAADRALAVAGDDPVLAALAAVPLGQALRAAGRQQAAFETTIVAAHQVAPLEPGGGTAAERAACAAALLQAALAAAEAGDRSTANEMLDDAAAVIEPGGPERAAVDAARVATASMLGDGRRAVVAHEALVGDPGWQRLPIEHRAAHLVDVTGAYLRVGDAAGAGGALLHADRLVPAEVRIRPAGRTALAGALAAASRPDPHLLALAEATGVAR